MPLRTRTVSPMYSYRPERGGVLIHRGKHCNSYFYVPTEAHLHAAALQLLGELKEGGWYEGLKHDPNEARKWGPKHPGMEPDEIAKLPSGPIHEAAVKAWKMFSESRDHDAEANKMYKVIEKVLKTRNGELAWRILQERAEGEYERVENECLQTVEPLPRPEKPTHGHRWVDSDGKRWIFDGKNLGWIGGDHAQWSGLYAAHEQGTDKPEVEEFRECDTLREVWSSLYAAEKDDNIGGEAEPVKAHPDDFKTAIQDTIDVKKYRGEHTVKLMGNAEEALKAGKAVFCRPTSKHNISCVLESDATVESLAAREERREKAYMSRKKKSAKKKAKKAS